MPIIVNRPAKTIAELQVFEAEMVGRNCRLVPYKKKKIKPVPVSGSIIAYCSPDSTFAVTRELFDTAKKSILIGIYDFSAPHMREILLAALARGVKVTLMLDIDSKSERDFFDDLVLMGMTGVAAPSCANKSISVFSSSHEKVIIIDSEWCLVQSGNYSSNSIPLNVIDGGAPGVFKTGNRDTGLAFKSKALASVFAKVLKADMALVPATAQMLGHVPAEEPFLVEAAPRTRPATLFPSKTFTVRTELEVLPVLSPDNYMDVMPSLLSAARKSILIEQQYIRANQPLIRQLLEAMKLALERNPALDIRIVLGKLFQAADVPKEQANLDILKNDFGLKIGRNIRYVNTDQLVHCHNKMIIVDGKSVLISSQNWSDSAVFKNREAGVWLKHAGISSYFTEIFETDWKAGFRMPAPKGQMPTEISPQALRPGGFIPVVRADYEEV